MRNRRITKAYFRTCSTCRSRSQAPFCLYTLRAIADRAEGTFARLRYSLGGDRPSQTTRLPPSPGRIHSPGLESRLSKGGISPSAPRSLATPVPSLPPILHIKSPDPMAGYSKGARGLFVLSRVIGILTDTPISPSSRRRQRPSRYAIRAGRNLPDKEFRYLRTVIVTAAVYRGFSSKLRRRTSLTSPFNLPAPGRRQCLYVVFATSQTPVFLLNSRLGRFSAARFSSTRNELHLPRAPLLPKLRGHFAEFLLRGSLEHLRLLASPTCVGLRYGQHVYSPARLFSAA
jgi:hypothetical protein